MKKWIVCLLAGISLLAFSSGVGGQDGVRCDGELMSPGDICESRSSTGEVTSSETYDEVKAGNERAHRTFVTWGRWALLGGGILLTGLAIWGIVRERRRRKAEGQVGDLYVQQQSAAQPNMPAHVQPHMPPPQQTPPQQQMPQQQQMQPSQQQMPPHMAPQQPHMQPQQQYAPQSYPPPAGPAQPWGPQPGSRDGFGPGRP
jgi:hypothetical protein